MPTTYEKCDDSVRELLNKLIGQFHPPLKSASVTFDLVFASKTDKDDQPCAAIKLHGVAAAAKVKITSLEDRARGVADAKILIDRYDWYNAKPQTRAAILDHELTHIKLKDEGELDDLGRPKLAGSVTVRIASVIGVGSEYRAPALFTLAQSRPRRPAPTSTRRCTNTKRASLSPTRMATFSITRRQNRMPKITYSKGRTVNLGNFESQRVDIRIEIDCDQGKEDQTFDTLKTWVEGRLKQETNRG